jgi:serine/threonine protein kinase
MQDCVKGIKFIEDHNLILRNLKPENILISSEGIVKLSDFTKDSDK